jgi:hypothetical protein
MAALLIKTLVTTFFAILASFVVNWFYTNPEIAKTFPGFTLPFFTATMIYAVTTLNELVAFMLNLFEENKNLKLENRLRDIIKEELKSELEPMKDDIKTIKSQHSWIVQSIRSIAGHLKITMPAVEISPIVEKVETTV